LLFDLFIEIHKGKEQMAYQVRGVSSASKVEEKGK